MQVGFSANVTLKLWLKSWTGFADKDQMDLISPPPRIFYDPQLQIMCCYIAPYYVKNARSPGGHKTYIPGGHIIWGGGGGGQSGIFLNLKVQNLI